MHCPAPNRSCRLLAALLLFTCAPGVDEADPSAFELLEETSDELFAGPSCAGTLICTDTLARPMCTAAAREASFLYESAQTFAPPVTGQYSFVRLGFRRVFPSTAARLRVEVWRLGGGAGPLDLLALEGAAELSGSLIARTNGPYTVHFDPPLDLVAGGAVQPGYALVLTVPSGRLTVGVACAEPVDAYPAGAAYTKKRVRTAPGNYAAGSWTAGRRDFSFAVGLATTRPGPCAIDPDATCDDGNSTSGDGCSAECAPEAGFSCTGQPATCVDDDECLVANGGCDADATCANAPGGRTCTCNAGYEGDGLTCSDVDECLVANGGCSTYASCTNTTGGRTCACTTGYTGDGVTCTDVNGCAGSPCFAGVTCTDVAAPGLGFSCGACPTGYTGDGVSCTDVNGCAGNPCFAGVTCTDVAAPGTGFTCGSCPSGYSGNGQTCTDINECLTNNGGCSPNASCSNTAGSRTCACNPGFTGNGLTCSCTGDSSCGTNNYCVGGACQPTAASCKVLMAWGRGSGTYVIKPIANQSAVSVYCDNNAANDGGGWTRVVNIQTNSISHGDVTSAVGDVSNAGAAAKLSDEMINALNTVGYFRYNCAGVINGFVRNSSNVWTSIRSNGYSWSFDRGRDGTFECGANRSGYVFSDYAACPSGHTNYVATAPAEGYGCYAASPAGWGRAGNLWAK